MAYDALLAAAMLAGQRLVERLGGLAPLNYPVSGQLNGLFVLCVAAGYLIPLQGQGGGRLYLWIFGVGLKALGTALFLARVSFAGDPAFFLVFAGADGLLAVWTWWVLRQTGGKGP